MARAPEHEGIHVKMSYLREPMSEAYRSDRLVPMSIIAIGTLYSDTFRYMPTLASEARYFPASLSQNIRWCGPRLSEDCEAI